MTRAPALVAALVALLAGAPAATAATYRETVLADQPAGYWPLDEATAPVADAVTGGLATPTAGATLGAPAGIDAGGTSLTLTGTAAVGVGPEPAYGLTGDLSVEAWVAPTGASGDRYVLSRGTRWSGFHLYLASGRVPTLDVNGTRLSAPAALRAGGWHHVVGTLTARATALYVDGALVRTGTVLADPRSTSQGLWLGRLSRSSPGWFQGGLDEVALYRQGLGPERVAAHFAAGADTSTPVPVLTAAPGPLSDRPDGAFAFTGSKGGLTYACALDDAAATDCSNGALAYEGLRDGAHALTVTATDRWGTTGATTYGWRVALSAEETAAPVSTVTDGPAALTNQTTALLRFSGSKPRVTFACRLDGRPWSPCAGAASYSGLGEGEHRFEVRATDRWGTVGEPRAVAWVVDLTPPDTVVLASRAGVATEAQAVLGSEPGARFECRSGNGEWAACDTRFALPRLPAAGQLVVRAIDAAGNADPVPAVVVIEPPPASEPITFAGAGARFTVGGVSVGSLRCSLDGAEPGPCPWPLDFAALAYGPHTLTVIDTGIAGVVFPTIAWDAALPRPLLAASQFPAVLQLGSRRGQAGLAAARLPRLLFQSNVAGRAALTLRRRSTPVHRWTARVVQGSNLIRLPRRAWRRLRPGRYGLEVRVANASGSSPPLTLRFDAVRTPRR